MANGFTIPTSLQLNLGTYANDGTGDDLRTAFQKIKDTFDLINSELGVIDAANLGSVGEGIYAGKSNNQLQLKRIQGINGVTVTSDAASIKISALSSIQSDADPKLGGDLNLNGYHIIGAGDVRTTVYGLDIRSINNLLQLLATTNNYASLDFGSFTNPLTSAFDLGTF